MVRFCEPGKVTDAKLVGFMVAYFVAIAAAWSNPARLAPHTTSILLQSANVIALIVLITTVSALNKRAGCGIKWTFTWITAGVLGCNLIGRLLSVVYLRVSGKDKHNRKAKYVRWDRAAAAVGTVATLSELYFAVVPRRRFRIVFFVLVLIFGFPAITTAFAILKGGRPDIQLLKMCVEYSQKAYDKFTGAAQTDRVYTRQISPTTLAVSFAGTETSGDVKVDASIGDVDVPLAWTLNAPSRAHAGFVGLYAKLRDHVHSMVKQSGASVVIVTGHSLGGALATLAGPDLAGAGYDVKVVTFGAPPVGDGNFVKMFDSSIKECVRVVNPHDPVTTVPGSQFLHTKGFYPVASLTKDFLASAHSLSTYELALGRPRWVQYLGMFAPAGYLLVALMGVVVWHAVRHAAS